MSIFGASDADFRWHVSSYSANTGGNCIQVGWRVSTHSPNTGGNCVEAGPVTPDPRIAVRDTKDPARRQFTVPRAAWKAFVRSVSR